MEENYMMFRSKKSQRTVAVAVVALLVIAMLAGLLAAIV